jgi:ABC-type antimicrobial peptide transport system permease subunit
LPVSQAQDSYTAFMVRLPTIWMIRTRAEPHSLANAVRTELEQASGLPAVKFRSMDEVDTASTARQDFNMILMLIFGGSALLLAAIGIYGLMAFTVQQRTKEIGIRIALGAASSDVRRMVLAQGMGLVAAGTAIGVVASLGLARFLVSFLFGVAPLDPMVFVAVPLVLGAAALGAMWLPARSAMRVNPVEALRGE